MRYNRDVDTVMSFLETLNRDHDDIHIPEMVRQSLKNLANYIEKDKLEREAVKGIRQNEDYERYGSAQVITDISKIIDKAITSAYNDGVLDASIHNEKLYIKGLNDAWNTQREIINMNIYERQEAFGKDKTQIVDIIAENDPIEAMHKVLEWKKKKVCEKCNSRKDSDYCEQNDDFCSCVNAFKCKEVSINDNTTEKSYQDEDIDTTDTWDKIMPDAPLINKIINLARQDKMEDIYVALMNAGDVYFTKSGKKVVPVVLNRVEHITRKLNAIYIHLHADNIDNEVGYVDGIVIEDRYGFPIYIREFDEKYVDENGSLDAELAIY